MKNKKYFIIRKERKIRQKDSILNLIIFIIFLIIININSMSHKNMRNLNGYNSKIHLIATKIDIDKLLSSDYNAINQPTVEIKENMTKIAYFCEWPVECSYNIILKFNFQALTCKNMFKGLTSIIEIDLSNFDFSRVTDISFMFSGCLNLKNITFGNINTSSLQNINTNIFSGCSKLISLNFSNFDFSKVTDISYMFSGC